MHDQISSRQKYKAKDDDGFGDIKTSYKHPVTRGRHNIIREQCSTYAIVLWISILMIIFGEYLLFHYTIAVCSWPELTNRDKEENINVILIGDPQLTDQHSYWFMKIPVIGQIVEYHSDIYMRKNFQLLLHYHNPSHVVFMGDLFDSGRSIDDLDFQLEFERFEWIFKSSKKVKKFYLSGNHDLGYDIDIDHQLGLSKRFIQYFNKLNFREIVDGIEFVFISATTIEPNTAHPDLIYETKSFIENYSRPSEFTNIPKVLFHHVPLWRPPGTDCGKLRTRNKAITDRVGHSYRNMLSNETSSMILSNIKPFLTFSGDDHDQCKVRHSNLTTEYTVGTFNWLQGNFYPSFVLLSVEKNSKFREEPEARAEVQVCFTANRWLIYQVYVVIYILCVGLLVVDPLSRERKTQPFWTLPSYSNKFSLLIFRFRATLRKIVSFSFCLCIVYIFLLWLAK